VLAVDYPAGADPAPLAEGFWSLLDGHGIIRSNVLGSSFAAYWLQHAAVLAPERIGTLFLCCGFADGSAVAGNPLFDLATLRSNDGEAVKASWAGRLAGAPQTPFAALQRLLLAEQAGETLRSRLLGAANAKTAPPVPASVRTVLIEGTDDPLIPLPARVLLRQRLSHAAVEQIEGGGHYPHVLSPDAFGAALGRHLSSGRA
jgi:pimeloyl-ACP methyl ester carboxylesterase